MAAKIERKAFDKPDETRPFKDGKGKVDVITVGEHTVGRGTFEPGWRWSEHVKPIAGTPSCQAAHTGYVLEGRRFAVAHKTAISHRIEDQSASSRSDHRHGRSQFQPANSARFCPSASFSVLGAAGSCSTVAF